MVEADVTDKTQQKYACNIGTKGRSVTQIDVGIDSLVVMGFCYTTVESRLMHIRCSD